MNEDSQQQTNERDGLVFEEFSEEHPYTHPKNRQKGIGYLDKKEITKLKMNEPTVLKNDLQWQDFVENHPHNICPKNIPIVELDASEAWDSLPAGEAAKFKKYAHYFSLASWSGQFINCEQTSQESADLLEMFFELFLNEVNKLKNTQDHLQLKKFDDTISDEHWQRFLDFMTFAISNLGNYKCIGDTKMFPNLSYGKFEEIINFSKNEKAIELWNRCGKHVYNINNSCLSFGFPPENESQYLLNGVTKEENDLVQRFIQEKLGWQGANWNTRLMKLHDDTLVLKVASMRCRTTGTDHVFENRNIRVSYGDYAPHLKRVIHHLQKCMHYTSVNEDNYERQLLYVTKLVEHFITGDIDLHKEASDDWVKDAKPVIETYIGFIESLRDPSGSRAEFEGMVAIVNNAQSKKFSNLIENAEEYLTRLPWGKEFEKDKFVKPSFTSLDVLTFTCGVIYSGICLPNYDEVRKNGFKNVALGNVSGSGSKDTYRQFLSGEDGELMIKYGSKVFTLQVGLHELLGHGSGKVFKESDVRDSKVNFPGSSTPIESFYREGESYGTVFGSIASGMEECRAELVALYLFRHQDFMEIFDFQHSEFGKALYCGWLSMCWMGLKSVSMYNVEKQTWGSAHARARFFILRSLFEKGDGLVDLKLNDEDKNVILTINEDKILTNGQPIIEMVLREIHVARCTGDKTCSERFENLTILKDDQESMFWKNVRGIVMANPRPRDVYVQPNTVENPDGSIHLKRYKATPDGIVQSFVERTINSRRLD